MDRAVVNLDRTDPGKAGKSVGAPELTVTTVRLTVGGVSPALAADGSDAMAVGGADVVPEPVRIGRTTRGQPHGPQPQRRAALPTRGTGDREVPQEERLVGPAAGSGCGTQDPNPTSDVLPDTGTGGRLGRRSSVRSGLTPAATPWLTYL